MDDCTVQTMKDTSIRGTRMTAQQNARLRLESCTLGTPASQGLVGTLQASGASRVVASGSTKLLTLSLWTQDQASIDIGAPCTRVGTVTEHQQGGPISVAC